MLEKVLTEKSETGSERRDTPELREQMRVIADDVKKLGAATRQSAAAQVDAAREQAGRAIEAARSKKEYLEEKASRAIGARPFTSVLVSAGIGAAVACLWTLRGRRGPAA